MSENKYGENILNECADGNCGEKNHIRGILCDVKNCRYHSGENQCTAKQIKVCPAHAEHSEDTACATFQPRAEF